MNWDLEVKDRMQSEAKEIKHIKARGGLTLRFNAKSQNVGNMISFINLPTC